MKSKKTCGPNMAIAVKLLRFGGKPFFPQNGGSAPQKGGHDPPFEEKRVLAKRIILKCTDRVFLRYWFGKYREIPTQYRPKIPNRYTTLQKIHILAKDVVGLLLGEVVSTKIITHHHKGCGWLTSRRYHSKNDSLTKMKTY